MNAPFAEWATRLDQMLQFECAPIYRVFNQGVVWRNREMIDIRIVGMDPVYRYVAMRHLTRRARRYATRYCLGEAMAGLATVESIDSRQDSEGWIRTTVLYRALAADLPPDVAAYARHHSTCTVRTNHNLRDICTCHRAGCPVISLTGATCTCQDREVNRG